MKINPASPNSNQASFGTKTRIEGSFFEKLPVQSQKHINNWVSELLKDKHTTRELFITGRLDKDPRICTIVRQDLGYGVEETRDTAEFLKKPLATLRKMYSASAKEAVQDDKDINRLEEITLRKFEE